MRGAGLVLARHAVRGARCHVAGQRLPLTGARPCASRDEAAQPAARSAARAESVAALAVHSSGRRTRGVAGRHFRTALAHTAHLSAGHSDACPTRCAILLQPPCSARQACKRNRRGCVDAHRGAQGSSLAIGARRAARRCLCRRYHGARIVGAGGRKCSNCKARVQPLCGPGRTAFLSPAAAPQL